MKLSPDEAKRRAAKARATRTSNLAKAAESERINAEHQARMARVNLAWKVVSIRGMDYQSSNTFVCGVADGSIHLREADVAAEIEARLLTVKCHEACKDFVRKYGSVGYPHIENGGCQVCAHPLLCAGEDKPHTYRELGQDECRHRGIYHAGNCWHVSECKGCGNVYSVDSSG